MKLLMHTFLVLSFAEKTLGMHTTDYTAAFIRKSERILTGMHIGSWWGRMWPGAKSKAPFADWANLSLT
jgi:hypothetical protein